MSTAAKYTQMVKFPKLGAWLNCMRVVRQKRAFKYFFKLVNSQIQVITTTSKSSNSNFILKKINLY